MSAVYPLGGGLARLVSPTPSPVSSSICASHRPGDRLSGALRQTITVARPASPFVNSMHSRRREPAPCPSRFPERTSHVVGSWAVNVSGGRALLLGTLLRDYVRHRNQHHTTRGRRVQSPASGLSKNVAATTCSAHIGSPLECAGNHQSPSSPLKVLRCRRPGPW